MATTFLFLEILNFQQLLKLGLHSFEIDVSEVQVFCFNTISRTTIFREPCFSKIGATRICSASTNSSVAWTSDICFSQAGSTGVTADNSSETYRSAGATCFPFILLSSLTYYGMKCKVKNKQENIASVTSVKALS